MGLEQNRDAGIYCRLSVDDERAGESVSIFNQRMMLEKYVAENGFENALFLSDDGYSGTNFQRPLSGKNSYQENREQSRWLGQWTLSRS